MGLRGWQWKLADTVKFLKVIQHVESLMNNSLVYVDFLFNLSLSGVRSEDYIRLL